MIAFDLDDVIIDITPILAKPVMEYLSFDCYKPGRKFKYTCPNYSEEKIYDFVHSILLKNTLKAMPCYYSLEIVKQVYEITNKPVIFITARSKMLEEVTYQWLDLYLDVPYELFFSDKKEEIILDRNIKTFVDDRYKTVIKLSEICNVYMISQPWNFGREVPKNVVRIDTLKEINLEDI